MIVELSTTLSEARPCELDPSFYFRVDVGVFVDNAAQIGKLTRLFVLLVGSLNNKWLLLGFLVWCPKLPGFYVFL